MVKTEVINGTNVSVNLKEGNAGVFRDIKTLKPNEKYDIVIDPNATYREYVAVTGPASDKVFVTSDDCIDNAIITIVMEEKGGFKFNGTTRASREAQANAHGILHTISKNIRNFFARAL